MERPHFFDMSREDLRTRLGKLGMPGYRCDQVINWVYRKAVADPEAMTNLPKLDRQRLAEAIQFTRGRVIQHQRASDGTQKLLIEWDESAARTECVMIPAESAQSGKPRRTACISTQVGCPVGCRFCASGIGGLEQNLSPGQIVEQVYHLNAALNPEPRGKEPACITHIVYMGMGEPLSNYDATVRSLRRLMTDWAFDLGGRHITVSTVGLPAQMRRLADLELQITLAISLHAPTDALRGQLIPWAQHTSIDKIIEAGRYYFDRTGRELTLEYILLGQVNDRAEHARQLVRIARQIRANINLIRYNEVAGLPYQRPSDEDVRAFQETLRQAGVSVQIRASRGRDISAACGQLRHEAATA
jgi:23S rRNA (adenine2503-C2)-methyltransferase